MVVELLLQNKELIKTIYALLLIFFCAIIVLKIDRVFKISDYQGLRYLRNSFFFYGLSFVVYFILGNISVSFQQTYSLVNMFLFSFLSIVGSLFLIYSLTWKYFEKKKSHNSLINLRSSFIYLISLILSLKCIFTKELFLLGIFQIFLLGITLILSLKNLLNAKEKNYFLKYYFFAVMFSFVYWVLTTINYSINLSVQLDLLRYSLEGIFYIIFLMGILNLGKNKNG